MTPSDDTRRGWVIPIGGAEDRQPTSRILRRFVDLCGGEDARLAVIPTASVLPDTGPTYEKLFRRMGAAQVEVLSFDERGDCEAPAHLAILEAVDGVFLTGGNQLRLSTIMGGTRAAELIRRRNRQDGLHVAGTSAGAAIVSEHMIAFGDEGPTPRSGQVTLAPGLGLTRLAVVDQHFRQRNRLGRLVTALAYNPRPAGLGIDEDTAAFIDPEDRLEVVGSGAVTVVDATGVEFSSIDEARRGDPVSILGLRVHILVDGGSYHLVDRSASSGRVLVRNVS